MLFFMWKSLTRSRVRLSHNRFIHKLYVPISSTKVHLRDVGRSRNELRPLFRKHSVNPSASYDVGSERDYLGAQRTERKSLARG